MNGQKQTKRASIVFLQSIKEGIEYHGKVILHEVGAKVLVVVDQIANYPDRLKLRLAFEIFSKKD